MTDLLLHDLTFQHAPRISDALFAAILTRNHSPAVPEAAVLSQVPPLFGLDSAIALAFFHHESSYGSLGAALATRNWGNLRRGQGHAIGMLNGFATYRTWADSLRDWCTLISSVYVQSRKLVTVRQALPVYAPSSDGNAPTKYADAVIADVARWMAEDALPDRHAGETHYRVKQACTGGATIRTAPRTNAAVLGRLHAGDDFWGEPIPGQFVTVKGFDSGSTWVRDSTMRCVWQGLLDQVTP